MTPELRFDFVVSEDQRTITVKREFSAERQLVWDCHTKRELLDQWFAPKGLTTQTKYMDFREGEYWHYAMITTDGQKFWNRLDYKTIKPIDGYTARDGFCNETGAINPSMPGADWDVTFAEANKRTLVTTLVLYASSEGLQSALDMGLKDGLTSTFEKLDELLARLRSS